MASVRVTIPLLAGRVKWFEKRHCNPNEVDVRRDKMPFSSNLHTYFSKGPNLGGAEVCAFLTNGIHFAYFFKA